jgi:hypothetical protein
MYSEGSVSMKNLLHKHVRDSVLWAPTIILIIFLSRKNTLLQYQYVGSYIMSQQNDFVDIELHILHFENDYNWNTHIKLQLLTFWTLSIILYFI